MDRDTVDTACNGLEVYSEITDESTRYEIFKGHVDFYPANNRNLSFSLKVTEFSISRTAS